MTRAVTEEFAEMVVEIETTGGALPPAPVGIMGISNANPTVVTVGTGAIDQFVADDTVTIAGVTATGFTAANGVHVVSAVSATLGTITIDADTSGATGAAGPGGAVTPANQRPAPIPITSISKASPAVVTVGTAHIGAFVAGDKVIFAGVTNTGFAGINGEQIVGVVTPGAGTFTVTFDASLAAAAANTGTVQPAAPASTPLVWAKICGLTSRTVTRTATVQTSEVPDCDDESLPASVERAVQSSEVQVTGTGVWAAQSDPTLMDWWYSGKVKNVRVTNVKMPAGGIKSELGPALLTNLSNTAARGTKVTADITLQFDGLPQLEYA